MLTLRRHEKDFLARRAPKYHAAFTETSASMKTILAVLHTSLADAGGEYEENLGLVTSLSQNLEVYGFKFNNLVELQKTIGLNGSLPFITITAVSTECSKRVPESVPEPLLHRQMNHIL